MPSSAAFRLALSRASGACMDLSIAITPHIDVNLRISSDSALRGTQRTVMIPRTSQKMRVAPERWMLARKHRS